MVVRAFRDHFRDHFKINLDTCPTDHSHHADMRSYRTPMAEVSDRLARRVVRDFGSDDAALPLLAELEGERIQAAVVIWARGDIDRLREGAELARRDWRDALVRAGLADDDWRQRLDAEI